MDAGLSDDDAGLPDGAADTDEASSDPDVFPDASSDAAVLPDISPSAAPDAATLESLEPLVREVVGPLVGAEDPDLAVGAVVALVTPQGTQVVGLGTRERGGAAVDAETTFQIGSVTKVFTGLLLATLAERPGGPVAVEDPVNDHLIDVVAPELEGQAITLEHLATHYSALDNMPSDMTGPRLSSARDYSRDLLATYLSQAHSKGLYSLHRKIERKRKSAREIMDRLGLRVIVRSVRGCYAALGLLHTHYRPIPGTFKDYIGLPKVNGYQSLHTCVYPVREISRKPVEFQIRTQLMHMEAEFGAAAHWRYKSQEEALSEEGRQLRWLQNLPAQHDKTHSHLEFVELLRRQVFEDGLVLFGDGGSQLRLPVGSTVGDFLRRFHPGLPADQAVRVNDEVRPASHLLADGDCVELERP